MFLCVVDVDVDVFFSLMLENDSNHVTLKKLLCVGEERVDT